jgi:Acetyltransferase (GNAT) family
VGFAGLGRFKRARHAFTMEFKFITKTLVYEYAGEAGARPPGFKPQDEWRIADPALIDATFRDDTDRTRRFQRYLRSRHAGLILVRSGAWISYGWCSSPQAAAPPHLPAWASRQGAYWIFGCHTHERYRCRGIYKQLLARLIALVFGREPSSTICIDTHAENIASRRAIAASGFRPCGVFSTCRIWAPFMGPRIIRGRWRREEPHPDLPGNIADDPRNVSAVPVSGGMAYKVVRENRAANFD